MELKDKMESLLDSHKKLISTYEEIYKEYESADLLKENSELKVEIKKYKETLENLNQKYQQISSENSNLKLALNEQILNEKLNILKISQEKIHSYFQDERSKYKNKLLELEAFSNSKIEDIKNIAALELDHDKNEFIDKADKLLNELNNKIAENKKLMNEKYSETNKEILEKLRIMSSEPVSEEVMKKRLKQNDIEIKIGLNWVNKIGILLILFGVAAGLKYSYDNYFAQYMKGFFTFIIGALFLGAGEYFVRKGKDVFAKGLTGGGIGILYFAIFNAYFNFKLIGTNSAMFISILVTLTAFVLALRNDSKTICAFSLIGGYLPFVTYAYSFEIHTSDIYTAMIYLLILNVLTLSTSYYKKWTTTNYVSFILNIPTLLYLNSVIVNTNIAILYSVATFFMYLAITLVYPLKQKQNLKVPDIILLGLNTVISCIVIYNLFDQAKYNDLFGMLALVFCLIYFGIGQLVNKLMPKEQPSQVIFYLTALTFAILTIPLQFGIHWLAFGWLIEGVVLVLYGFKFKFKYYELAGWVIYLLCMAAFFFIDITGISRRYFDFKYFSLIMSMALVLGMYLYEFSKNAVEKYTTRGTLVNLFKYFTVLNAWGYLIYISNKLYDNVIDNNYIYYEGYFSTILFVIVTVAFGYGISKINAVRDKVVDAFIIFLYVLADLICISITALDPISYNDKEVRYIALMILIIYNILVFFSVRDLLIRFIRKTNKSLEIYPLGIGIYLIGIITSILTVQFDLGHINLLFSLIYLALAFIYIAYGFKQRYSLIRRFGLGLAFFATGKLFIYDLSYLHSLGRIIAYFCFGLIMLAISFIYQKLKNNLDNIKDSIELR